MAKRRYFHELMQVQRLLLTRANERLIDTFGVTAAQLALIYLVAERKDCTAADVARELRVRKSGVSGIVRRLEDAGLLRREPDAADGRRSLLRLTEQGAKVRSASIKLTRELQREWFDGLAPEDIDAFGRVLEHTIRRFDKPTDLDQRAPSADTKGETNDEE